MFDALGDQHLALSAETSTVFLLRGRRLAAFWNCASERAAAIEKVPGGREIAATQNTTCRAT